MLLAREHPTTSLVEILLIIRTNACIQPIDVNCIVHIRTHLKYNIRTIILIVNNTSLVNHPYHEILLVNNE